MPSYLVLRHWRRPSTSLAVLAALSAPLLLPATVPGTAERAPAWIILLFEWLFGSQSEAGRSGLPLLGVALVAALALGVFLFVRREQN